MSVQDIQMKEAYSSQKGEDVEMPIFDVQQTGIAERIQTSPMEYTEEMSEYIPEGKEEELDMEQVMEYLVQEYEETCDYSSRMQNEEQIRMGMIQEYIAIKDYENLNLILNTIPFPDMARDQQNKYLIYLLSLAYELQDHKIVQVVVKVWQDYNPGENKYPITTGLYIVKEAPEFIRLLKFMDDALDLSYAYHAMNLVRFDSSPHISVAIDRLERIYGQQPSDTYKKVYDMCIEEYDNIELCNTELLIIMEEKYRKLAEVADTPMYMIYNDPYHFPTHDDLMKRISGVNDVDDPDKQLLEYITGQLELIPEEFVVGGKENAKSLLLKKLEGMTREEKLEHSKELQNDVELFRILGPANPGIADGVDVKELDCPCMMYGGHRMFTCYEYENFDDDGEILDDSIFITKDWSRVEWFKGSCDNCMKVILFKQRAVRMPMLDAGGWKGCYCSWECVKEDVMAGPEASLLVTLIKQFAHMTEVNGIYERYWTTPRVETVAVPFSREEFEATRHLDLPSSTFGCCASLLFPNIDVPQSEISELEHRLQTVDIKDTDY